MRQRMNTCSTLPDTTPSTPLNDLIIELIYAGNYLARMVVECANSPEERLEAFAAKGRYTAAVEAAHKAVRQ